MGGQDKIRNLWRHYYTGTQGLIFVVDSQDRDRIDEARQELHRIISDREMKDCLLLVFANKQDLPGGECSSDNIDVIFLQTNLCAFASHVSSRGHGEIGFAQDERSRLVCPSIMRNYRRRSFRRLKLVEPKRKDKVTWYLFLSLYFSISLTLSYTHILSLCLSVCLSLLSLCIHLPSKISLTTSVILYNIYSAPEFRVFYSTIQVYEVVSRRVKFTAWMIQLLQMQTAVLQIPGLHLRQFEQPAASWLGQLLVPPVHLFRL